MRLFGALRIRILGYAPEAFPPTDFHSATLLEDRIILVGSLGYTINRQRGVTQILTLELDRWQIAPDVIDQLREDLIGKLRALEHAPIAWRPIPIA